MKRIGLCRKEIEGGQLDMADTVEHHGHFTGEETAHRYMAHGPGWSGATNDLKIAQEWLAENKGQGAVYIRLDSTARYTKDLEEMLKKMITTLREEGDCSCCTMLVAEAKALLERTGYTEDF